MIPAVESRQLLDVTSPCLSRDILIAIVYADVFDFALTHDELYRRVVHSRTDPEAVRRSLRVLASSVVYDTGKYVCLRGREHLVNARAEKAARAERLWKEAHQFGGWFRYVPFVRAVAVSGSLAVGNAGRTCDVDLFCITAERRLWISRLFIVPLSKLTRYARHRFPAYLCPNYILDEASLALRDRNLFTAHEVIQAVPLWGRSAYEAFRSANGWTAELLPNARGDAGLDPGHDAQRRPALEGRRRLASTASQPLVTRMLERILGGLFGDLLNALIRHIFITFYRFRAGRRGWPWHRIAAAYQVGRYMVPEGGYASVVASLFRTRLGALIDGAAAEHVTTQMFPEAGSHDYVQNWPAQFADEYGMDEYGADEYGAAA